MSSSILPALLESIEDAEVTIDRHRDGGVACFTSPKSVWDVNFTVCGNELKSFTIIDRTSGEFYRVAHPYSLPEAVIISSRIL